MPEPVDHPSLTHPVRLVGHREHQPSSGRHRPRCHDVGILDVQRDPDRGGPHRLRAGRVEVGRLGGDSKAAAANGEQRYLWPVGSPYAVTRFSGSERPLVETRPRRQRL